MRCGCRFLGSGLRIAVDGRDARASRASALPDGRAAACASTARAFKARAVRDGADWHVFCDGDYRRLSLGRSSRGATRTPRAGSLAAPMPGKVIKVHDRARARRWRRATPLLILEAMKMEHTITAPATAW